MRQRTKGLLVSLALAVGLSAALATVAMAAVITGNARAEQVAEVVTEHGREASQAREAARPAFS